MNNKSAIAVSANGLAAVLRWLLGIIFLYSGWMKMIQPQPFLENIYAYDLVGPGLAMATAIVLPWLEIVLGFALLARLFPAGSALGAAALGTLFLAVQVSAVVRGLSISCGCFGADSQQMIGKATLFRTALVLAAALAVLIHALLTRPAKPAAIQEPAPVEAAQ